MFRWIQDYKKEILEKKIKKQEDIKIQTNTPYSRIIITYELLIISISSFVHSIFPFILPNHASDKLIKLYFNTKIMENYDDK